MNRLADERPDRRHFDRLEGDSVLTVDLEAIPFDQVLSRVDDVCRRLSPGDTARLLGFIPRYVIERLRDQSGVTLTRIGESAGRPVTVIQSDKH
jgi:hypothetical protein